MTRPLRALLALFLVAVALLASGAPRAAAVTWDEVTVPCPACEASVEGLRLRSYTTSHGDSDGCRHIAGPPIDGIVVWTCTHCGFTRRGDQFETSLPPEVRERIRAGLAERPALEPGLRQDLIPVEQKFDLLVRTSDLLGDDVDAALGARLSAAFAVRCGASRAWQAVWDDPEADAARDRAREWLRSRSGAPQERRRGHARDALEFAAARAALAEAPEAGADALDVAMRRLCAAWRLRVAGENAEALPALRALAESDTTPAPVRATATALLDGIDDERRFQSAFLERAASADAEALDGWWLYQVAEIRRRLGRAGADAAYVRALECGSAPPWAFDSAVEVLRTSSSPLLPDGDRLDELRHRTIRRLGASLANEDEFADGLRAEWPSADRTTFLIGATECTVAGVVVDAIGRLGDLFGEQALRDDVRAALVAALRSEDEDVSEAAAWALCAIGDPRSADALVARLSDGPEGTREAIALELGIVVRADDVDALLAYAAAHDAKDFAVVAILEALANRSFADLDAFRAWWQEHRAEPRIAWVDAGFAAAGVTLAGEGRDTVPALLAACDHATGHVRVNAVRRLMEISGEALGWEEIAWEPRSAPQREAREELLARWRDWYERR